MNYKINTKGEKKKEKLDNLDMTKKKIEMN